MSSYTEYEALHSDNGKNIANFIFKSIVCRWGTPIDLITNNGTMYIAVAKILSDQGVNFICISPYNSQANSPVEQRHRNVREALMKTAVAEGGDLGGAAPGTQLTKESDTKTSSQGRSEPLKPHQKTTTHFQNQRTMRKEDNKAGQKRVELGQ